MNRRTVISILVVTLLFSVMIIGNGWCAQDKVTQLTFWHSMGGVNGNAINTMAQKFNNFHKDIQVKVIYQGSYDEALIKLKTAMRGKSGPDICQVYDIGTRYMIDSGWILPMQNLINKDKQFDLKTLEPNLLSYYTVGGKLYSMPFNSSTPILYYNKTAFKEAGLDPEKPPKTFAEIEEYSKKLVKMDGKRVERYGYSMAVYGWFFEQFLAKQGALYVNNQNGRAKRATAVAWDKNGTGLKILTSWKRLVDSGVIGNFGRKTDDTKNAFSAGRTAMIIDSTASLGGLLKAAGNRFEIGTAFLPVVQNGDQGGVCIGGGSLWAIHTKDKVREKATWEVIKYMVAPEQQVYWSSQSGYFPVTLKAYNLPEMNEHLKKFPQFKTAIDQLHQTKVTSATSGGLIGVFSEARQTVETEIELMLQNRETPEEAIKKAANNINAAIVNYNKTVK